MVWALGGFCKQGSRAWGHSLHKTRGSVGGQAGGDLLPSRQVRLSVRGPPVSHPGPPPDRVSDRDLPFSRGGRPGAAQPSLDLPGPAKGHGDSRAPAQPATGEPPHPSLSSTLALGPQPQPSGPAVATDPNWTTRLSFPGDGTPRWGDSHRHTQGGSPEGGHRQASQVTQAARGRLAGSEPSRRPARPAALLQPRGPCLLGPAMPEHGGAQVRPLRTPPLHGFPSASQPCRRSTPSRPTARLPPLPLAAHDSPTCPHPRAGARS